MLMGWEEFAGIEQKRRRMWRQWHKSSHQVYGENVTLPNRPCRYAYRLIGSMIVKTRRGSGGSIVVIMISSNPVRSINS